MNSVLQDMNDEDFIEYVKENCDNIENIIINNPVNNMKKGQIHPEEIFSIIMSVNSYEDIDVTILRDFLINNM